MTLAFTDLTQVVFCTSLFAFASGGVCGWLLCYGRRREGGKR